MAVSLGEIKKMCKEKGDGFRAASLFGIGKNDSGKCDFFVTTSDAAYAVKVLSLGEDAQRVYFYRDRGYFTVKTAAGDEDYMWVRPNFPEAEGGMYPGYLRNYGEAGFPKVHRGAESRVVVPLDGGGP